jgi:hypothetical protein
VAGGRAVPHVVDQTILGHRATGERQERQDRPLLGTARIEDAMFGHDLDRSEQPEVKH